MILVLDINALVGRWPFWRLKYEGFKGVLSLMDRAGIDKAAVTSLDSVFHLNYQNGNDEVAEISRLHPERFIPFVVINPVFPLWKEHLNAYIKEYKAAGVKLHPDHHKYSLLGREVADVMKEARKLGLPVYIQTSIWDMRHHPGYCIVMETPILEVASAIKAYPENKIIVGGAKHFFARVRELLQHGPESRNFYIETSGLGFFARERGSGETLSLVNSIEWLTEAVGSSRLLFGTRMPILIPEAGKSLIEKSKISGDDKERILGKNAEELLKA